MLPPGHPLPASPATTATIRRRAQLPGAAEIKRTDAAKDEAKALPCCSWDLRGASKARSDLISPALTALNFGQLPVVGLAGVAATASIITVACAAVLGFAAGAAFALGLTLPPLLSTPGEVARLLAAMFTISYAVTVLVSVLCGAAWDLTGTARVAFLPMALAVLPSILLAPTIRFDRKAGVVKREA